MCRLKDCGVRVSMAGQGCYEPASTGENVSTNEVTTALKHRHLALSLYDIKRAAAVLVDLHRLGSWHIHLKFLGKVPCCSVPTQRHINYLSISMRSTNASACELRIDDLRLLPAEVS